MEAEADYLVTGDRRHLLPLKERLGARILNAPLFLSALARMKPRADTPPSRALTDSKLRVSI